MQFLGLGNSCPKLRKIALSGIKEYPTTNFYQVEGLFKMLTILELWFDEQNEASAEHVLLQLMISSVWIESVLIKKSEDLNITLMRRIWQVSVIFLLYTVLNDLTVVFDVVASVKHNF